MLFTKALFSIIIKFWIQFVNILFQYFCIYIQRLDCSLLIFFVQSFSCCTQTLWHHGVPMTSICPIRDTSIFHLLSFLGGWLHRPYSFQLGLANEWPRKKTEGWKENEVRAFHSPSPSLNSRGNLSGTLEQISQLQSGLPLGSDNYPSLCPFKLVTGLQYHPSHTCSKHLKFLMWVWHHFSTEELADTCN